MGKSLVDHASDTMEIMLESGDWPRTPEELGEDLHDALMRVPHNHEGYSKEFRKEVGDTKQAALKRIVACRNGQKLLDLERRIEMNRIFGK